jgi:hypothetical protein
MFCLDPLHPLYTAVLEIVSASPGISIADLHAALRKKKTEVTLQHVYRTVNRLVKEQILLKTGTTLSVNLMWLSYLQFFAERSKNTLLEETGKHVFPLQDDERRTFKVDSLLDLQTLWNHLLVELHRSAPQTFLMKYYSHAWWQLGAYALDPAFYKRIREAGLRCYWLFGNTTVLDKHAAALHEDVMDVRLIENPPFPTEGYCLNVYGPYIFECLFPEKISKLLDVYFHSVQSIDQFDPEVFSDIFTLPSKITLKVWKSESQALGLRRKIEQYFVKGLEEKKE